MREGQESDIARLFNGNRQHALMLGASARDAPRDDLASFGQELSQHTVIFKVDINGFLFAEPANFLARKAPALEFLFRRSPRKT